MLVAEKFIRSLIEIYGSHTVCTDEVHGIQRHVMWLDWNTIYTQHLRRLWWRVNQYFKDRTEGFNDYYPWIKNECTLFHVYNWIQFFISMYNNVTTTGRNDFNFEFNGGKITLT